MYLRDTRITTMAIGMLIRNTSRHPHGATPTSNPPRIGPNAVATPPRPDQAPTAVDLSSLRKDACRIASEPGVSRAAPAPCNARMAISTSVLGASAQPTDARVNHTTPT